MVMVVPFKALRPDQDYAKWVASPPYDVVEEEEAKKIISKNPFSFLRVEKSEADLLERPSPHAEVIYDRARENLEELIQKGILIQETNPLFYIYAQGKDDCWQYGLVGCVWIGDYERGNLKKHELTRQDKETDRILHVEKVNAHTGPVFITYREQKEITSLINSSIKGPCLYNFNTEEGVAHRVWRIEDGEIIRALQQNFSKIDKMYIADGHHRAAAAAAVARRRRKNPFPGKGESEYLLAVLFPHTQMKILPYHRLVKDLAGLDRETFLKACARNFHLVFPFEKKIPTREHEFGMYLEGKWYQLRIKERILTNRNPVSLLDVSLLQDFLLGPILKITDPRTDSRISFVGGNRTIEDLEHLVNTGEFAVAFSLFPVTVEKLMEIADAGEIMPPKSTWFEPKLLSGLFIHLLD